MNTKIIKSILVGILLATAVLFGNTASAERPFVWKQVRVCSYQPYYHCYYRKMKVYRPYRHHDRRRHDDRLYQPGY